MQKYEKQIENHPELNDGIYMITEFDFGYATPKKTMNTIKGKVAWEEGVEYEICVTQFKDDGRFAIFKALKHYKEPSGHKVYNSIEEMREDFDLKGKTTYKRVGNIKKSRFQTA